MRREKLSASLVTVVTLLVGARCAPVQSRSKEVGATREVALAAPAIDSARPDSVEVPYGGVVEVTLHGTGFVPGQPGQNTVHFSSAVLRQIAASGDGQRIVFVIPDAINSGGEAPPMQLRSGSYNVSVQTTAGTSNAVRIRVYR